MHIANVISIFRILTLPFIVYLLSLETAPASFWALVVFGFAILSDVLDNYLHQKNKREKIIGSFLDPLADKILIVGLLFFFAMDGSFSKIVLLILIFRDVFTAYFRFLSSREDIIFPHRRAYAQTVTFTQFTLLFLLLARDLLEEGSLRFVQHLPLIETSILLFTAGAVLLALGSFSHLLFFYIQQIQKRRRERLQEREGSFVVFANRRSRGYYNSYRRRLLRLFAKRRGAEIFYFPTKQQEMYLGMEKLLGTCSKIVIAGGDGTFESALNYPPLYNKTLGFFPLGAGNAFYSYFYKGKRYEYLRSRFPFREQDLDVVELQWEGGRRETLFVNLGVDADVIKFSQDRTEHGFRDYLRGSWRALRKAKAAYTLEMEIDGKKQIMRNCSTVLLGKVPYLGYGIRSIVGHVKPSDGKIYGVAIVNRHSSLVNKPLRIWALLLGMFNLNIPPLYLFKGKSLTIRSSHPFPIQAGGEFLGESTWVTLTVKRRQKVLMI